MTEQPEEPMSVDDPAPPSTSADTQTRHTFPGHYRRLQEIEKRVVHALEAASFVMAELSKEREHVDKQLLHTAATGFIKQIQEAQQLVLRSVQAAAPDRDFEANNYFLMVQAMCAAEKLDAVSVHISGISKLLKQPQQQAQQQAQQRIGGTEAQQAAGGGADSPP